MSKLVWVAVCLALIPGCNKRAATESDAEDSVATTIGALSSATKTLSPGAIGRQVTSCGETAVQDECDEATKTKKATYTDCEILDSDLTFSGTVTLTYSGAACNMLVNDNSVVRTMNISRQGLLSSLVTTSSEAHNDYRGNSIGGGQKLTKTSSGYTLEVLGLHKVRTNSVGTKTFDISFRTTTPYTVAVAARNTTVNTGTLEVIHNLAEYTASFTSEDLTFSSACCTPISGSIDVTYSGTITGEAKITFDTCGKAMFERNGTSKEITLSGCE